MIGAFMLRMGFYLLNRRLLPEDFLDGSSRG